MDLLKTLTYIIKMILTIFAVVVLISLFLIYPVYILSDKSPELYNRIVIILAGVFLLYSFVKKILSLGRRYNSAGAVVLHLLTQIILPVVYLFIMILSLAGFYRVSFIINFYIYIILQIVVVIAFIMLTLYLFNINSSFKRKLSSENTSRAGEQL